MKFISHVLKVIIPVTAYVLYATGCTSEGFSLGEKYLDSNIHTAVIDTCTVKMTTVAIDSVPTSGNNIGLIGQYSDPYWGKVKATTYVSYSTPKSQTFDYKVQFDSVALVMNLSGTYIGDTIKKSTINIYMLNQAMELPEKSYYYSNWSIPYNPSPIASFTFAPHPYTTYNEFGSPTSLKETNHFLIRLPDSFGSDLFNKILTDSYILQSDDNFREYFPGFALTAGENNHAVVGFDISNDSIFAIRLYYHHSTYKIEKGQIDIPVDNSRNFYGVTHDRSGTPFNSLEGTKKELPTASSDNMGLVQALTATYVKIEFPYLNNLLEMGDYGAIIDAALFIYPVKDSYSDENPLPKALSMYVSDENNVSLNAITSYGGDALQTGNLTKDDLFKKDTYYTYDITSFVNGQLGAVGIYKRNLRLVCPEDSLTKTLNTLTFCDQKFTKDKTRLILKYLVYENE